MGCMGRPLVDGERPVLAGVRLGRARKLSPTIAALGAERRRVLTEFWTTVALAEHASIAEFHRVSLELMRHGAPAELLAAAQRAAADEARHARHAFALASAYAGRSVQPAALPLGDTVALAPDLVSLASTTLRDGCAGETCSAWLYARLADRATDPTARRVLHGIVRDETRHAELAWAVLRWAVKAGGAPVRAVVRSELRAAPPAMAIGPAADDASLAAHGWAPAREQARFIEEVWRAVVVPVAAALAA